MGAKLWGDGGVGENSESLIMVTRTIVGECVVYLWSVKIGDRVREHGLVAKLDDRKRIADLVRQNRQEMRAIMMVHTSP